MNLEYFQLSHNQMDDISWQIFAGMKNLEDLKVFGNRIKGFKLDHEGQLFADLKQLRTLDYELLPPMFALNWTCNLSSLEKLVLSVSINEEDQKSSCTNQISTRFSLPQLSHLVIDIDSIIIDKIDLSTLLACFSHVEQLEVDLPCLKLLRSGVFKEFTSLKRLSLKWQNDEYCLDSITFTGLDHISELEVTLVDKGAIKPDALRNLTSLKAISFYVGDDEELMSIEDSSLFSGLDSLTRISIIYKELSQLFVFFTNLNKFIFIEKGFCQ